MVWILSDFFETGEMDVATVMECVAQAWAVCRRPLERRWTLAAVWGG